MKRIHTIFLVIALPAGPSQPVMPDDALYEQLQESGLNVAKIGEAKQVSNLRAAVTEGANVGLILDTGLRLNAKRSMISRLPTEVVLSGNPR